MSDVMNNQDEIRELMADYLGGELDEAGRAKFEAMLEGDEQLAAEVKTLRATQNAMRSLDTEKAEPVALTRKESASSGSYLRGHLLRYAAVLVLAFLGGYIIRGLEPMPAPLAENQTGGALEESPTTPSGRADASEFERRLTREYLNTPSRSGLGRSLIAYARASRAKF